MGEKANGLSEDALEKIYEFVGVREVMLTARAVSRSWNAVAQRVSFSAIFR
jgi:hypothetical protein